MNRVTTTMTWAELAEAGWTGTERAEYERAGRREAEAVGIRPGVPVLRETLLCMSAERPDDEELRRELARLADDGG